MEKPFKIQPHTTVDKEFVITGPDGFRMMVDYDDVDHRSVEKTANRVVKILNQNWKTQ